MSDRHTQRNRPAGNGADQEAGRPSNSLPEIGDRLVTIDGETSLVIGPTAEDVAEVRKLRHGISALIYRRREPLPSDLARAAWEAAGGGAE